MFWRKFQNPLGRKRGGIYLMLDNKRFFQISLVANFVLAGFLAHVMAVVHAQRNLLTQPSSITASSSGAKDGRRLEITNSVAFKWEQMLDPRDYRVFIKNLRVIGCPEVTLRDIVAGDARRAFNFKRRQLGFSDWEIGAWSSNAEQELVARLLGETVARKTPIQTRPINSGAIASQTDGQNSQTVFYPMVFRDLDWSALGLNEDQAQAVEEIKSNFVSKIGGSDQNPDSPEYMARWQAAQPEADEILKAVLGHTIFQNIQLMAASAPMTGDQVGQ